jgi:type II secretory pathway predicted ATPase ExeA/septal ring-binding cell division protein DamX
MALYLEHYGLKEPPFRITPHTDFFFEGADRGATLEALIYAVLHDEGIVKVSGEVGSGKTMLCRVLMERLPANVDTIYIATPSLARDEILEAIGEDLGLALAGKRTAAALRELQEHLIARYGQGRRVVILIDEAHAMPEETLEEVRLLSNLESNRHKLLQIVLFGQPELDATLAKPSLRQLRDRVTHAFRMRPLSKAEAARYLSFRMRAAGYRGPEVFAPGAVALIAGASDGLTRRINILADKALLSAFTENGHAVTLTHARAAVRDSEFASMKPRRAGTLVVASAALVAGLALGVAAQWIWMQESRQPVAAVDPPPAQGPAAPAPAVPAQAAPPAVPAQAASPAPTSAPEPAPTTIAPGAPASAPGAPAHLRPEQSERLERYSPAGHRLLAERIAAAHSVLDRAPDEGYSIELFTTDNSDPARMERFLLRARDYVQLEDLFVIPLEGAGQYRLRVVYGEFPTRDEAAAAGKRLPPRYQEAFRTELRSFGELRGQI